jgi:trans-2,3-dihydro-3-hydroxyanthranilate isomerase
MVQRDPVFGAVYDREEDREEVARAIGLHAEDLSAEYPPQTVSTGVPFCIVLLRSLAVSQRLQLVQHEAETWAAKHDAQFFYCVAPLSAQEAGGADWHARMQFYSGEDPATGSAAGCCIAWLVKTGLVASGKPVVIEQGIEIERPSRIGVEATLEGERVHSVRVSGCTVSVAEGRFFLP